VVFYSLNHSFAFSRTEPATPERNIPMTRNELIELLSIPEDSPEAEAMRGEASALSHKRFHDTSLLLG
jgi:hypothetical protein